MPEVSNHAERAETARLKAILTSPAAKSRERIAWHLAFETALPAAVAIEALSAWPAGEPQSTRVH